MKHRTWISIICIVLMVAALAGCGTTRINEQAMTAHDMQLRALHQQATSYQSTVTEAAAGCQDDMCRVAVMLAGALGRPEMRVQAPQLRSAGEEFSRAFQPIGTLLNTGLQVWGAGYLVDRAGRNATDLVGAVGGVVGNVQGPVDNSVNVGGNYGDTRGDEIGGDAIGRDRIDDRSVGRDHIGRDQRIGDDIDGSCVGDRCRNHSPGPIDNSISPPPDEPDPDP